MRVIPNLQPASAYFSSGPCKKRPQWSLAKLAGAAIGRSHRSDASLQKIKQAIELTRELLQVPNDYEIALVPASDTGAMEMAMWNLLGSRAVTILVYEYFAQEWLHDITEELKIKNVRSIALDSNYSADLDSIDFNNDFVFVLNGTVQGLSIASTDFIARKREGLVICDASAGAFSQNLDFSRLDVTTFSCQKVLGAEASHGIIILSPRALQRIEEYAPPWPIPKILRLKKDGQINHALFQGQMINTPSMLCVEDYLDSLQWVKALGGVPALMRKIESNDAVIKDYVESSNWLAYIVEDEDFRAKTAQCLRIVDSTILSLSLANQAAFLNSMLARLAELHIAYDIKSHRAAPMGLRIWTGATIEEEDLRLLCQWLDFIFFEEKAKFNL